jgi:two-component system, NarL family, response regulator NreC
LPVSVLIADDHPLIRSGLRSVLERDGEFRVVAEAANGTEAVDLAVLHKPDVILLDVGMPRLTGLDAAKYIHEKLPRARIVILSMHADEGYVLRALNSGAAGYLIKASQDTEVIAAVRAVAAGRSWFSPEVTRVLMEEHLAEMLRKGVEDSYELLSIRERELMRLLVCGRNNREIAEELFISIATVETHRNKIFRKLAVHNLPELILYAVRKGLVA